MLEADTAPQCPRGHEQYVADEKDVLGPREVKLDTTGQDLLEYAALAGFIALMCISGVLAFGLAVGG